MTGDLVTVLPNPNFFYFTPGSGASTVMSTRRIRNKKLGPFVPLENEFRATRAWKALSFGARCLYIELKGFYSHKHQNNVFISVRDAITALGRSHCYPPG